MQASGAKPFVFFMVCGLTIGSGLVSEASAKERWVQSHPRRAEVNARLANENRRINQELREGEISRRQAAQLHQDVRDIRQQERQMAEQHGGHITRQEQRALNHQANQLSRKIGR